MSQDSRSGLAGQCWLGASFVDAVKMLVEMSAGLHLSKVYLRQEDHLQSDPHVV